MTLFLKASSFYSIFTHLPKTLTVLFFQVGILETLPQLFWI